MQLPTPAISILVPTYNYGRYLPQTIESILLQDFSDYEIIVSDDCSTDHTREILVAYAHRDPRLRIHIQQRNLGMVYNWNWCLQQARGHYIKYLFGDDTFAHPATLSRLKGLLDQYPQASLAGSARLTLNETSKLTGIWDDVVSSGSSTGAHMATRCLRSSLNLPGEPSAVIFRRSQAQRGFDLSLKQIVDLEMWLHLLMQGDFAYTSQPLCCFRIHGKQQTAVNRQHQIGVLEIASLLDKYLPLLDAHPQRPLGSATKAAILYRALHQLRKKSSGQPAFVSAIQAIVAQLPFLARALCSFDYRLRRPLENIRRNIHKRIQHSRLKHDLHEQKKFLSSLPPISTTSHAN